MRLALPVLVTLGLSLLAPAAAADHSVLHDAQETLDHPTEPSAGSIKDPCFDDQSSCGGCGPDLIEWIIGPIFCP
jgi:hypothetical protein